MKKNPFNLLMICTAAVLVTFSACKKQDKPATQSETATHSDDQMQFTTEMDAISDESNDLIRENASFNFRNASNAVCDGRFVVDTTAATKTITITYDGGNCSGKKNRTRTGSVILSMPKSAKWSDAGAQLTISYRDLKVTRISDKRSMTLNGSTVITNVSGGTIAGLANSDSMVHTIKSDGINLTFGDGTSRIWMVSKERKFSYDSSIVIRTSGTHVEGNKSNISEWGVNRGGQTFTTVIADPLIIRQDCSFRVTSGRIEYNTDTKLSITFGLNVSGIPTPCPGTGNYYFKAEYTDLRSITHTLIWPY